MKKETQEQQVIQAMRSEQGFATLRRLNEIVDFSLWRTKTPEATIRRIVQQSDAFFRIQPGLWALQEAKASVYRLLKLSTENKQSEEAFGHGYYQGLTVEIGKFLNYKTYVPAQDKHRMFLDKELGSVSDTTVIPPFAYDRLLRRAKTVDVIWFNERMMPSHFYEIEHTTDIKSSLFKFYELQDFFARFYIVAAKHRSRDFKDKLSASMFDCIRSRVGFLDYERVASMHATCTQQQRFSW